MRESANGSARPASKVVKGLVVEALSKGQQLIAELPALLKRDEREVRRARNELATEGRLIVRDGLARLIERGGAGSPGEPSGETPGSSESGTPSRALPEKSLNVAKQEAAAAAAAASSPRGDSGETKRGETGELRIVLDLTPQLAAFLRPLLEALGARRVSPDKAPTPERVAPPVVHRDVKPSNFFRVLTVDEEKLVCEERLAEARDDGETLKKPHRVVELALEDCRTKPGKLEGYVERAARRRERVEAARLERERLESERCEFLKVRAARETTLETPLPPKGEDPALAAIRDEAWTAIEKRAREAAS